MTAFKQFQIRELVDADWDVIAGIIGCYEPGGVTGDILRQRNSIWDEADPRLRLVATSEAGKTVGYCRSTRRSSEPDGIFRISVYIDPQSCGVGLGRQLLSLAEAFAKEHGGKHPMASVEEMCARGIDFATKAGYAPVQHLFESRLDLVTFDPGPYQMAQACLEDEGYRFPNFEDLGDTPENWTKLWQLDTVTDRDTPGSEFWSLGDVNLYTTQHKEAFGYSAAGMHIAVFKDQWVGVNIVSAAPKEGEFATDYTGVLKEHRGKGLATVLKVLGIQYGQGLDGQIMVTNNDERNAPMLAVNRKLGFEEKPGFFVYRKDFAAS